MSIVKTHFEREAKEFDEIILKLIPHYDEMIESLVLSIPHNQSAQISIIDLGCGTGTISKAIKLKFPNCKITCMDLANNMIEMCKLKLSGFDNISYQVGDFNHYKFSEKYDIVVSSLALHHLITDTDKKSFYKTIFNNLNSEGVFINADVILGTNDFLQNMYIEKWKDYMRKSVSNDDIENVWLPKYREEDKPIELMKHILWLSELGFTNIDIIWKYYNFSVFCGRK